MSTPVVVNISLGGPGRDYDTEVEFLGNRYRLVRVATGGSIDEALAQIDRWAGSAAAIGVSGIRDAKTSRTLTGDENALRAALQRAHGPLLTTGHRLRDVLQEWTVRHVDAEMPGYFANARVVLLGGSNHERTARVLAETTKNIRYSEPSLQYGPSWVFDGVGKVVGMLPESVTSIAGLPGRKVVESRVKSALRDCDVVVGTFEELEAIDVGQLTGKTVVSSGITEDRLAALRERGVNLVLDNVPQPFDVVVNEAALEALMLVAAQAERDRLTDDDMLDLITSAELQPRVIWPEGYQRRSRFAFVIHPLSQEFFRTISALDAIAKVSPAVVMDGVEKMIAHAPPFLYSTVTGIKSPTGAEAEGWLITVGGTPKELMSHDPEFTYKRLLAAADMAQKMGAQIMGLGAFTKVVGDAGVTVAKRAPLPITTGNSYSASGALWAAHDAIRRLGVAEVDETGRLKGKAMVVGATGAIGSVCARLLAMATDELWLVSIEPAKLLALKADIERENPRARVFVAASADDHIEDMDVIVTATSGAGKKVLDIMKVKPGAVITDVARPLDLSAEDVANRPDVLVIESGEIELPGDPRMKEIGLPPGVAYACLAETIVLALEGRYETFTIGRNIEWEKVKEIYRLGIKHGMKLAAISGVNGVYSDEDVARVRELALAERAKRAQAAPAEM